MFAAKRSRFTAAGEGSVPLERCGRHVPNIPPQGFSLGSICHHALPSSDYGSVPLPLYLPSAPTVLARFPLRDLSHLHLSLNTGKYVEQIASKQQGFFLCPRGGMFLHLKCLRSISASDLMQTKLFATTATFPHKVVTKCILCKSFTNTFNLVAVSFLPA